MTSKVIGIISNRDFYFKNKTDLCVSKLYYSVPSTIIDNFKDRAMCVLIPYQMNFINKYIDIIDGLILIGSDNDIPPDFYGDEKKFDLKTSREKSDFEIKFVDEFLKKNRPILGICAGMQVINIVQNGTLYQSIKHELESNHEQDYNMSNSFHKIKIQHDTILFKIFQEQEIMTNSYHNQCIKNLGRDLLVSGKTEDNIIEAIELKNHRFCLGVQWHPEFNSNLKDHLIFEKFYENL